MRPGADYENLYKAALCRSQADWAVGINSTRLFSCLYGTTLNVGRVQTPTLAMIVDREKAITDFVSKPFYTPVIDCGGFVAVGERCTDFKLAEEVRTACDGEDARCLSVEKKLKTTLQPKLYDLTSLQRDANSIFGFTAQETLDYMQSLYEARYVTYPRTDSQYLSEDMGDTAVAVINSLTDVFPFAGALTATPELSRILNSSKVTDHHAIIPTVEVVKANLSKMPQGQYNILSLVVTRLLCAVAPVHRFETVTAIIECGGHRFTAKGKTVLEDGWRAIDAAFRDSIRVKLDKLETAEEDCSLPIISEDQIFKSVTAALREGKTKPPARFTEGTLLHAMETAGVEDMPVDAERKGLGTPATRAGSIEKIIKSGFVERQKKILVPTQKGINLIAVLPDEIKSPTLTAEWEQKLKLIQHGELSDSVFMADIETLVTDIVSSNTEANPEMAAAFASLRNNDVNGSTNNKHIGSCPRCQSGVIESAKGFFCSAFDCKFVLWKDSRFWSAKGKTLSVKVAAALLAEGRVSLSDLKSERTGKTYAATIVLLDDGNKTDYKLEFDNAA